MKKRLYGHNFEERGVYWAPRQYRGRPLLYAVDSHGDEIKRLVILEGINEDAAIEWMWCVLDAIDPVVKLELVRDTPRSPAPEPKLPPYADARAYERRLVRAAATHRHWIMPPPFKLPSSS